MSLHTGANLTDLYLCCDFDPHRVSELAMIDKYLLVLILVVLALLNYITRL